MAVEPLQEMSARLGCSTSGVYRQRSKHKLGNRVGSISRSEENQADCDAGASTRFARNARRLPLTDVFNSATLLYQLGDRQAFGRERASDPGAHGTLHQRLVAFTRGYL